MDMTKPTRAVQISFWDEIQNSGEAEKSSEIDVSELKSMFSAINPDAAKLRSRLNAANESSGIVQIIEHRRAYNCEFMLSKVRIPLNKLMDYVVALEDSAMLDAEQVENLRKFCPTEEEMELLKDYEGDKDRLGKCEKFFLELMKVPRSDIKLRVYSYKLQFNEKVSDLWESFNSVNCAVEEIRTSAKLKRVMQTLVSLGSALNQRTRNGAVESRLESLLILTEKRSRNSNMTLMHYLCKVLADKQPEVLDFSNDLRSLRSASKIQMKILAEEIQTISRGLEIAKQESSNAKRDSIHFWKASRTFIRSAEGEVKSLVSQFKIMAENQAALIIYFGEDRFSYTFERIVCTLQTFIRKFHQANEEYVKLIKKENRKLKSTKAEAGDPLVEMSEGPATESSIVAASSGTASEDPVAQNAEERRVPKRPRKDLDPSSEENLIPAAVSSDAGNI